MTDTENTEQQQHYDKLAVFAESAYYLGPHYLPANMRRIAPNACARVSYAPNSPIVSIDPSWLAILTV
jgi:hypothetical protein